MAHIHAKGGGQRSVSLKDRMETNGRTDGADCITLRAKVFSEM